MSVQLATKAVTAAVLNGLGDIIAQLGFEKGRDFDWRRLGVFTFLVGGHLPVGGGAWCTCPLEVYLLQRGLRHYMNTAPLKPLSSSTCLPQHSSSLC